MTYYSNAFRDRARLAPKDGVPALGVLVDPQQPGLIVGQAFVVNHIGGIEQASHPYSQDYPPPEVVFRLHIDREWDGRTTNRLEQSYNLDGRFVLRRGVFVELAEDAV